MTGRRRARGVLTLYIATTGDDAWTGTLKQPNRRRTDGPFATLVRARDESGGCLALLAVRVVHKQLQLAQSDRPEQVRFLGAERTREPIFPALQQVGREPDHEERVRRQPGRVQPREVVPPPARPPAVREREAGPGRLRQPALVVANEPGHRALGHWGTLKVLNSTSA